jgi:hypothetical protein
MKKHFLILGLICLTLCINTSDAASNIQQEMIDFLKPKLNSDRIECFFGNYGIETLAIDSPVFPFSRITNLYSVHQEKKIMRTLAIVIFSHPLHSDLWDVHRKIIEGKSIGIALREENWTIHKNPIYFGSLSLSRNVMDWMDEPEINLAPIHMYRLEVSKNNEPDCLPYCTILEVHNPQYLTTEWLRALYEDQYEKFSISSKEAEDLLSRLSLFLQDFPLTPDLEEHSSKK